MASLAKRIGPVSDDTLGYSLERQSPPLVFALSCAIARRLKRNRVLRSDWSAGWWWGQSMALNLQFVCSLLRCLYGAGGAAQGERRDEKPRFSIITDRGRGLGSTSFPIPLGVRFQKNGEAEVAWCPGAAPGSGRTVWGRRFLDVWWGGGRVVSAGALVKEVERLVWLGLHLETEPARVIARGGTLHRAISRGCSGGVGSGDEILALAGG